MQLCTVSTNFLTIANYKHDMQLKTDNQPNWSLTLPIYSYSREKVFISITEVCIIEIYIFTYIIGKEDPIITVLGTYPGVADEMHPTFFR